MTEVPVPGSDETAGPDEGLVISDLSSVSSSTPALSRQVEVAASMGLEDEPSSGDDGGGLEDDDEDSGEPDELPDAVAAIPAPVGLDVALNIAKPLLLVHRSHMWRAVVPGLLDQLHAAHNADIRLGVSVGLRRDRPAIVAAFLDGCTSASVKIADPEGYFIFATLPGVDVPSRYAASHAWLVGLPTTPTAAWVTQMVDAQRDAGANLLLSPGTWMPGTNRATELADATAHARWTRAALRSGERMAVNLTLASTWLTSRSHLDDLLAEITESNESVFHIRVHWPVSNHAYGQMGDVGILDGYVELCNHMRDLGKVLILPNTDLTGWAALGWGAAGFGSGLSTGERAFAVKRIARRAPDTPITPRYLERALLHTVPGATHDALANVAGYPTCGCPYCVLLRAASPAWNRQWSALHHVTKLGELTAIVSGPTRGTLVETEVRAAIQFKTTMSATVPFTADADPRHLPMWSARLP